MANRREFLAQTAAVVTGGSALRMIRFFGSRRPLMKTTLIVIQNEADHAQAKALIEKLMDSKDPADRGL